MTDALSLDERYQEFRDRTAPVFAAFPQLEPMRHLVFRQLVINRAGADWRDGVKHTLRPLRRQAGSSGTLKPADVLVWVESSREVVSGALLPVIAELRSRGVTVQVVSHGAGAVDAKAWRCVPAVRGGSPRWAAPAWAALAEALPAVRASSLQRAFVQAAAQAQSVLDEAQHALETVSPKVVFSAATNLPGGAALTVQARARKIPSLLLQHGITQVFYTPPLADHMATWGASSSDTLTSLGVEPGTLLPIGSPRHDAMRASEGEARKAAQANLQRVLNLSNRPTFVFFSNGNDLVRNGQAPVECAQWLETVARELKEELNIVVRLHPNENGALYQAAPHLKTTKSELDLQATLDGCDAVASLCSTVLYEALLFRKPVWQFFADGWPELADNWKHGLARRVESCEMLRDHCKTLARDSGEGVVAPEVVETVFANHGRAAGAVADDIVRRMK